jgi:hypothetical protein
MSCDRNGRRCASAAQRNGISGYFSRYLNTLTTWQTYGDLTQVADIPQRVLDVTGRFFGIGDGKLRGIFGVLIATHLVEQITGAVATMGARMLLRGKPFGRYRGITLRESPVSPKVGRGQARLLGDRMLEAKGFYFHEAGRTWHSHTATYRVGDVAKTLTHIQSLSLPNREYFFDRELAPQDVVDMVLGDRDPDTIPGFIGACNEIDGVLGVTKSIKRLMYIGNWLLVDDMERDAGAELVDYDIGRGPYTGQPRGTSPASPPGGSSPPGGYGGYRSPTYASRASWSEAYRQHGSQGYTSDVTYTSPDDQVDPLDFVGSLWDAGANGRSKQTVSVDGRECPLSIRGIEVAPDGRRLAQAYYHRNNQWWQVKDERLRERLARDVYRGALATDAELERWAR